MTMRWLLYRGSMLLAVQALLVGVVHAQCRSGTASPPNVVLLVADDFGWSELPFFNPPINWKDGTPINTRQYRDARPELNRLAARLHAVRPSGELGEFQRDPLVPGETPPGPYTVIPLDATTQDPADHEYSELPSCSHDMGDCPNDVLRGFGGLRDVARGVTFSRFYAASAICASTRATIFSGRYPQRTGVNGNGGRLQPDEVTIAEHLIQGCPGEACFGWRDSNGKCCMTNPSGACPTSDLAPCYRTGLIGKWHLGEDEGNTTPWDQGFTEFIGHPRGCCRGHFSRSPLTCSPGPGGAPLYVGAEIGGTCTASLSSSRECCDSEHRYYVPGRGDRAAQDASPPCNDDVNERECSGGSNDGNSCQSESDCPGGFCWHGGVCLSGESEGDPCSTDAQCADASCVQDCQTLQGCKTGCFYKHKCGCNYGTRAYRDLAINFIRRHCNEPFFLTITFNATHIGHNAPHRTASHYRTEGGGSKFKFWGAVEELDAAAGRIIDELQDLGLHDNTLVFFTADQGRPGGNYGDPTLRGGKGGVHDGGIRIGLVGRARTGDLHGLDDLDAHVGSHVDILPTVAEAAGFPLSDLPTQNVFGTCADHRGCPADCPTETCNQHWVDGRSFYGLLTGAAEPAATPTPARDLTFASYGGIAVVARRGLVPTPTLGARVCGYVDENADHIAIRGGSCVSCGASCPTSTRCQILGKVCVDSDGGTCRAPNGYLGSVDPTPCTSNGDCDVGHTCVHPSPSDEFERCKTGCSGQGRACAEIHVDCNKCLDAIWKLKSGASEGQPLPTCGSAITGAETDALYDLATNPEEQTNLDCKEKLPNIWCDLKRKLLNWDECAADQGCEAANCEGLANPASCAQ